MRREEEEEEEEEEDIRVNTSTNTAIKEENDDGDDQKLFSETLLTDFINPTEINKIKIAQNEIISTLKLTTDTVDLFNEESFEKEDVTMRKLEEANESLRKIADDLKAIHAITNKVKRGCSK